MLPSDKDIYWSKNSYEWTMDYFSFTSNSHMQSWRITFYGEKQTADQDTLSAILPVFYLSPCNKIIKGTGVVSDPFILDERACSI